MKSSSSFHQLNADLNIGRPRKFLWVFLNLINNYWLPNCSRDFTIKLFQPEITSLDWDQIHIKASPSRALSELFWMKLNWEAIKSEIGNIHVLDTGCGRGHYALKLMDFSKRQVKQYCGFDLNPRETWEGLQKEYPWLRLQARNINSIDWDIPENTNFFMTQSAIEHFENDLNYFRKIHQFIAETGKNTVQVHLFPSTPCLFLYLDHGIRQYNPRTISKITRLFDSVKSYSVLYKLGGGACNKLHLQYITQPALFRKADLRNTRTDQYRAKLKTAIELDNARVNGSVNFYALIIHSNYKNNIFNL